MTTTCSILTDPLRCASLLWQGLQTIIHAIERVLSLRQNSHSEVLPYGGDFVPKKSGFPLNNPIPRKATTNTIYPCPHCKWVGYAAVALNYHLNTYHESVVAAGGLRVREKGGYDRERNEAFLLAHGYVRCPWWTVPCPTRVNPLMATVCRHLNDCPG